MELLGGGLLIAMICLIGLLLLAGMLALVVFLLKLGVMGSYWLKDDEAGDEADDYRLDQSHQA
jgi:flagellar basal body-associated protein FliL